MTDGHRPRLCHERWREITHILPNSPQFKKRIGLQAAAHILYANNISAALAGPPTAAFYGSDTLWVKSIILVNDPSFEDACNVLSTSGYTDVLMDQNDRKLMQPPNDKGVKWRLLSPKDQKGGAVVLAPASHWHFEVTDDTTIVVDGMRLPKFSSYLQALVSLLIQRLQSSFPTGYYELQAVDVWSLRGKYPNSLTELSPADRFFLEHFFGVRRIRSREKIMELWDGLNRGVMTVEEAEASVPFERPKPPQKEFPVISIWADRERASS